MKFITLAVVLMMLSSVFAGQLLTRGEDLKKYLQGAKDGTFIVLFYDREAPQLRTEDARNQIRTKILKDHPSFNYYEVDIQEAEYSNIVDDMVKLDREEVRHSPTILVTSEGRGYWAHGDTAVDDIVYHLPKYSIDMIRESREKV
mmetsp:Transcript_25318/g.28075  ORF Transcript_25318/g.28075 Transcript_25318/m.28075 type:complete len:145 (+) Transcript_25318:33-467(+)|eukprot:CAMPEP_0205803976 /NCGR_PEP_ID=MMETSP0205-20121125/6743_1 /ASSEMBLY_ACC=CAM_ASM_000278 /TAXON_ID=36767 /ORGANISM="Euplotes focardii, Strain TN1" /LENGTH=144 /DNA_ID=CAMNT_0053072819 /DNA_START=23 /DNA_END=457 /DNA_ORIENTATION=+